MAKFKNKKTKQVIEEPLSWYANLLRKNPCYEEIKEKTEKQENEVQQSNKDEQTEKDIKREE